MSVQLADLGAMVPVRANAADHILWSVYVSHHDTPHGGSHAEPPPFLDNCTVGIDDEAFPAHDDGLRWNGWVCPTFRREVAEEVTAYFNQLNASAPWPAEQDYFTWDGDVIVHTQGMYTDEPGYAPTRVEPDANNRYAIGAMNWTWRRTDGQDHPHTRGV